ncbi:hypothetical protein ATCC90586_002993 [Pythium insidiosum]|nr:hypothetical protein ATCC90586_002993 [Pythium insidiosum]
MQSAPKQVAGSKQPVATNDRDANGIRSGAWDAGFCDCFSHLVPNCCMTWCCPFVSVAQISARIGLFKYSHVLLTLLGLYVLALAMGTVSFVLLFDAIKESYDKMQHDRNWNNPRIKNESIVDEHGSKVVAGAAMAIWARLLSTAAALGYLLLIWQLRSKIRERFAIPGSCCGDLCASCCCSCCTIAQMATHVKSYKPGSCEFGPPDTLPAYK